MTICTLTLGALDTNCYIVWDDPQRALVIDPADAPDTILSVLNKKELSLQAVVLTHAHFDHMLAAQAVCRATNAPLWVGAGDAVGLKDPTCNLSSWFSSDKALTLSADRLLHEGEMLSLGEDTLTVWETPGHTPGCVCLLGDGVLFSGDTLFCGSIGRTDFPGGDLFTLQVSLKRLATLPDGTAVYSGHGPATTIGYEKQNNPYLR